MMKNKIKINAVVDCMKERELKIFMLWINKCLHLFAAWNNGQAGIVSMR